MGKVFPTERHLCSSLSEAYGVMYYMHEMTMYCTTMRQSNSLCDECLVYNKTHSRWKMRSQGQMPWFHVVMRFRKRYILTLLHITATDCKCMSITQSKDPFSSASFPQVFPEPATDPCCCVSFQLYTLVTSRNILAPFLPIFSYRYSPHSRKAYCRGVLRVSHIFSLEWWLCKSFE